MVPEVIAVIVPPTAPSGMFVGELGIPSCRSAAEGIEALAMLAVEDGDEGWETRPPLDEIAGICDSEADISCLWKLIEF